ncbi:MAG: POTRA domain-containing protein, partial [Desulfobacteraceae bacterium]
MGLRLIFLLILFYLFSEFIFFPSLSAQARGPMGLDPLLRPHEEQEPFLEQDQQNTVKRKVQPSTPSINDTLPDQKVPLGPHIKIFVKEIHIKGNNSISSEKLAAVTTPYLNHHLNYRDLEIIRRKLTMCYVKEDYINSGAILPDQQITNGAVTFEIIEGKLSRIDVKGNIWLRDSYYKKRIKLNAGPPVNVKALEEGLQMLQQHPLIKQLHAELKPGLEPGSSILKIEVEETLPYNLALVANNYQAPSVGAERGLVTFKWQSLTGRGDILDVTYGRSEGLDPLFDAG